MSHPTSRSAVVEGHVAAVDQGPLAITRRFYERLFRKHPEVRPLFHRNEPEAQQKMLAEILELAILHADDPSAIADQLHGLGRQHRAYGDIAPAHYDAVAGCLLETLEDLAPSQWTDPVCAAWSSMLDEIVDHMQRGHFGD